MKKKCLIINILEIALSIEKNVYINNISENDNINTIITKYRINMNKITKNIDLSSEVNSDHLINKIYNTEFNDFDYQFINKVHSLSAYDLCPSKSKNLFDIVNNRNNQKNNGKTSKSYTCGKCKQKETFSREVQLRSIDEGANKSITCISCGYNWII